MQKVALPGLAMAVFIGFTAAPAKAAPQKKCDEETQMQALNHSEPKDWPELYSYSRIMDYAMASRSVTGSAPM